MSQLVTDEDIEKRVETATGDTLGTVVDIDGEYAHVEPDPGVIESIRATLGWQSTESEPFSIHEAEIDAITADAIHLEAESVAEIDTSLERSDDRSGEDGDQSSDTSDPPEIAKATTPEGDSKATPEDDEEATPELETEHADALESDDGDEPASMDREPADDPTMSDEDASDQTGGEITPTDGRPEQNVGDDSSADTINLGIDLEDAAEPTDDRPQQGTDDPAAELDHRPDLEAALEESDAKASTAGSDRSDIADELNTGLDLEAVASPDESQTASHAGSTSEPQHSPAEFALGVDTVSVAADHSSETTADDTGESTPAGRDALSTPTANTLAAQRNALNVAFQMPLVVQRSSLEMLQAATNGYLATVSAVLSSSLPSQKAATASSDSGRRLRSSSDE